MPPVIDSEYRTQGRKRKVFLGKAAFAGVLST